MYKVLFYLKEIKKKISFLFHCFVFILSTPNMFVVSTLSVFNILLFKPLFPLNFILLFYFLAHMLLVSHRFVYPKVILFFIIISETSVLFTVLYNIWKIQF